MLGNFRNLASKFLGLLEPRQPDSQLLYLLEGPSDRSAKLRSESMPSCQTQQSVRELQIAGCSS